MPTLNLQVGASADDAYEAPSGAVTLTGINIILNTTNRWMGLFFPNVTIPQGWTIDSAIPEPYISTTTYDDPDVVIFGEDADTTTTFTTATDNISSRTQTTANVIWQATGVGAGFQTGPDIKTIIQEIVDRPEWVSGNNIAILFEQQSITETRYRTWDNNTAQAAKLTIVYSEPSGVAILRRRIERY